MRPRLVPAVLGLAAVTACSAVGTPVSPPASAPTAASDVSAPRSAPPARATTPERLTSLSLLSRPAQPPMRASYEAALVADHCTDRDLPAPVATDAVLTILDRSYALSADAVPQDLVPAGEAGFTGGSAAKPVRAVLIEDLAALRAAWEAAGLTIEIESAYRSYEAQAQTFDSWAARIGYDAALERTARPGHSEHQLGTAFDFTSAGWQGRFGDWAVESDEGSWLAANAWAYGFVMSYPNGSRDSTCFGYEPWHYRWIGRDAAAGHGASGVTLREYLAREAVSP